MKALLCWTLAAVAALAGVSLAQSAASNAGDGSTKERSAKEKLVGAWRLVSMEDQGADGKLNRVSDRKGILIHA